MLARGGTIHLVLPWPADEFVKTSVDLDGEGGLEQALRSGAGPRRVHPSSGQL